jgi:hypothetical protein
MNMFQSLTLLRIGGRIQALPSMLLFGQFCAQMQLEGGTDELCGDLNDVLFKSH